MYKEQLKYLLEQLQQGKTDVDTVLAKIIDLPYQDLGFAKIDNQRELRRGFPEVIYCAGKTRDQVAGIFERMAEGSDNILATRATEEMYRAVVQRVPDAQFHPMPGIITLWRRKCKGIGNIAVVCAGTSDLPVAEEAAITAQIMGSHVERLYDAGVAGLHRLLLNRKILDNAKVLVVVAGMEGALPSVVGGLVDKPVVAVPTSVGYGASFNGLAALLAMLNSCVAGITVVNIDNGFGAGYAAALINRLGEIEQ
ncbi:nickel pincer cofactor biosynthesis protein LarB [Desulfofalx alkaliphila]|uniref:nickel pincer cofactor biosynthesis protein LarB n=1 Tax=Desulfofalx alkaliphila TaxID=105483 RepID=UPI0004E164FE|nr:nickel pincer cofactor biosynthesis protein LarB [Desulfofalx alkaliphila]